MACASVLVKEPICKERGDQYERSFKPLLCPRRVNIGSITAVGMSAILAIAAIWLASALCRLWLSLDRGDQRVSMDLPTGAAPLEAAPAGSLIE